MHSDFIVTWLADRYGTAFSSATCELLRSYTNDVYHIRSASQQFVLKLYAPGWRTLTDVQWEIDLLLHLVAHSVPVAEPIAAADSELISSITTDAGSWIAVLFTYAPGHKPQPPFSLGLYEAFGRAIAQFHCAADSFISPYPRRALDTSFLIDEPVELAAPLFPKPHERTWLLELACLVKDQISTYAAIGLDWGPIHGDATLDNLHLTEDGTIVLYDFDSGGPGWRAADLQGWGIDHSEYQPFWDAFYRGYNHVRPLAEVDRLAAPYLTLAWDIWGMKIDLERRILSLGQEQIERYLGEQHDLLHWRSRQYGITI